MDFFKSLINFPSVYTTYNNDKHIGEKITPAFFPVSLPPPAPL